MKYDNAHHNQNFDCLNYDIISMNIIILIEIMILEYLYDAYEAMGIIYFITICNIVYNFYRYIVCKLYN